MSIPDMNILKYYILTMDCGHERRTSSPCHIGQILPCIDKSGGHYMEQRTVARITHESGRELESIGWMSPQTALHGAYGEMRIEIEEIPRWQWRKRRKLRRDASMIGRAVALIGLGR